MRAALSPVAALALAVAFVLLLLAALVFAGRGSAVGTGAVAAAAALGGGDGPAPLTPLHHPRELHPVGVALERYARGLREEDVIAVHPLDRDRYEPLAAPGAGGGGADADAEAEAEAEGGGRKPAGHKPAGHKPAGRKRHWTEYPTWRELSADKAAAAAYFEQRAAALTRPEFDWGPVLRELAPRLAENREYIGLADVGPDGKTLRIAALEASPVEAGTIASDTTFAAVPAEMVMRHAEKPALFMFHTHPADPRGSPLPSSHDLSTAAYLSATGRFAASAVVSRYGVLAYALDWVGYKAVNSARNWDLALSNLTHDIVAAHEAVRSWSPHTLGDYLGFYPRHRLFMAAWPSPEMVADGRRTYLWDLESPIDHELLAEHADEVARHRDEAAASRRDRAKKKGTRAARVKETEGAVRSLLGLD